MGSATLQLAKRRGADVIAVVLDSSHHQLRAAGRPRYSRGTEATLFGNRVDVVIDNVAGETFGGSLQVLERGGCLVKSGAIAGPAARSDLRQLYLKDITPFGRTACGLSVFPDLLTLSECNEIQLLVAKVFPLAQIAQAQTEFMH